MSPRRLAFVFVLVFGAVLVGPPVTKSANAEPVRRVVVNRIVAVVDREVITLVELRRRMAPFLLSLASLEEAKRSVAEAQAYRQLVDRLIEERLIARRARMASISVTESEIEAALDTIAQSNRLTREALLAEARATGLPESDYREEIRRQIVSHKLLRLYLAGKNGGAGMTDTQMEEARRVMIEEIRREVHIEVRL